MFRIFAARLTVAFVATSMMTGVASLSASARTTATSSTVAGSSGLGSVDLAAYTKQVAESLGVKRLRVAESSPIVIVSAKGIVRGWNTDGDGIMNSSPALAGYLTAENPAAYKKLAGYYKGIAKQGDLPVRGGVTLADTGDGRLGAWGYLPRRGAVVSVVLDSKNRKVSKQTIDAAVRTVKLLRRIARSS